MVMVRVRVRVGVMVRVKTMVLRKETSDFSFSACDFGLFA